MWYNEDSDGEETVSSNHLSGPQFSAQAQYYVYYWDAVDMVKVDRCDQNTSNYCISMRSKKWWWALLALILSMVMPNYWLLDGENKKSEDSTRDLLAFRREAI